jgi:endo-alpha-1,4-polygalactosaminidase (GH114 family)
VIHDTIENSEESKSAEIAEIIRLVEENRGLEVFQQNGTRVVRNKKGYNLFSANEKYAPPEAVEIAPPLKTYTVNG